MVVLGGSGFLGRHLRTAYRSAGADVVGVSRTAGPAHGGTGERSLAFDLAEAGRTELLDLLSGLRPDVIVNAAGAVWQVTEEEMRRANDELVAALTAAVAELPGRPRLIQLGSVHEYGAGDPDTGITEEREPAPVNAYGRSKLRATRHVLDAAEAGELDGVVLRMANIIGPGSPAGSLLGGVAAHLQRFARDSGSTDAELVLGPLRAERDFVDVRDVVDAVLAVGSAPASGVSGRVVNVGSGQAVRSGRVVERLIELSGLPVRLVERSADPNRSDLDCLWLDISRARRLLGWEPRRDLDASLAGLLAAV
uniref:NDP-hexose 4-ketoreductase n=1 Tax=Streptomyces globisporus TaxID=1908 RepID=A0A068EI21_STRGL|nr:NDP-hexose 4-ketoreductase [Streptomyces globisporus]